MASGGLEAVGRHDCIREFCVDGIAGLLTLSSLLSLQAMSACLQRIGRQETQAWHAERVKAYSVTTALPSPSTGLPLYFVSFTLPHPSDIHAHGLFSNSHICCLFARYDLSGHGIYA